MMAVHWVGVKQAGNYDEISLSQVLALFRHILSLQTSVIESTEKSSHLYLSCCGTGGITGPRGCFYFIFMFFIYINILCTDFRCCLCWLLSKHFVLRVNSPVQMTLFWQCKYVQAERKVLS